MRPHETGVYFTGGSYNNDIGPSRISTTSQYTASDGTFHDAPVGLCQNLPFTLGQSYSNSQNITIIMNGTSYPVRSQSFTVTDVAGSAGFDHGSITNNSDISASR